jgi:hypothetical protein
MCSYLTIFGQLSISMDQLTADAMAGGLLQGVSGLAERGRLFSPMLGKLARSQGRG